MNFLFVCTGNTCRSPLAEVIAAAEAEARELPGVVAVSAGTFAFPGNPAAGPGIAVAAEHGLDLSGHASRELSAELVEWADHIVGMDQTHAEMIERHGSGVAIHVMTDFLPDNHAFRGAGVPDPFGGDLDTYESTFDMLQLAMRGLFDALRDGDTPT